MQPIVFHLDMNSYFATVHQQDHPETRGKPVGICEHLGGIIIAASVEAKRWGIKTGTPVWEARKLYPKIILAPTAPERYRFFTRRFLKLMNEYSDRVEPYSIDEAFMDAAKACNVINTKSEYRNPKQILNEKFEIINPVMVNPFEEAVNIALEIKRRMKKEVGDYLTCSIGIAENKLLAKIGSDMKKPDGIVVIQAGGERYGVPKRVAVYGVGSAAANRKPLDATCLATDKHTTPLWLSKDDLYHRLKLTDIPGIGKRQERNLRDLGIRTLADLRDCPLSHLVARFGRIGGWHLYNMGQLKASYKAPVHEEREIKSVGHMYTLPKQYRRPEFFLPVLYKLCEMVGQRLRKKGLMGNEIHFFYRGADYQGDGQSRRLGCYLSDGREIFLEAARLVGGAGRDGPRPIPTEIKLIGITVAGVRPFVNQLSLFGDVERQRRVTSALDKINAKYGDFTVCRAPVLAAKGVFQDSVGFGRMKEL